jgi:hypothetical protein
LIVKEGRGVNKDPPLALLTPNTMSLEEEEEEEDLLKKKEC